MIILPQRWRQTPHQVQRVNEANSLTNGLVAWLPLNDQSLNGPVLDVVRGIGANFINGAPEIGTFQGGPSYYVPYGGLVASGVAVNTPVSARPYSMMATYQSATPNQYNKWPVCLSWSATIGDYAGFNWNATPNLSVNSGLSVPSQVSSNTAASPNTPGYFGNVHHTLATFTDTEQNLYHNGVWVAGGATVVPAAYNLLTVGNLGWSSVWNRGWIGWISNVAVWNRVLDPSEIAALAEAPWQIGQPNVQRVYFDIGAAAPAFMAAWALQRTGMIGGR